MTTITVTTGTSNQSRFRLFFFTLFFFRVLRRPGLDAAASFLLLDLGVGRALQILEKIKTLEEVNSSHELNVFGRVIGDEVH